MHQSHSQSFEVSGEKGLKRNLLGVPVVPDFCRSSDFLRRAADAQSNPSHRQAAAQEAETAEEGEVAARIAALKDQKHQEVPLLDHLFCLNHFRKANRIEAKELRMCPPHQCRQVKQKATSTT